MQKGVGEGVGGGAEEVGGEGEVVGGEGGTVGGEGGGGEVASAETCVVISACGTTVLVFGCDGIVGGRGREVGV